MPTVLRCSGVCGLYLTADHFDENDAHSTGRQSKCRCCAARYNHEYYERNRGRLLKRAKQWNANHEERRKGYAILRKWKEGQTTEEAVLPITIHLPQSVYDALLKLGNGDAEHGLYQLIFIGTE